MGRIGIRIANSVLFVLSSFMVANVINDVSEAVLVPEAPALREVEQPRDTGKRKWTARKVILDRNLFGAQVIEEIAPVIEIEPEPTLEETQLPLKLLGTIASPDQRVARAAIEDTSLRKHEVVKVGDTLKNHTEVQVAQIERGRVILQNGPRREELKLAENVAPRPPPKAAKRAERKRTSRRRTSRRESPRDRLQTLAKEGGMRSAAAIFTQARILPKYEDGSMVGLQLSEIESGSFYDKAGLHDGDIVVELNGAKIDNPSASKQVLDAFTSAEDISAQIRDASGNVRTVNLAAEELMNILNSE